MRHRPYTNRLLTMLTKCNASHTECGHIKCTYQWHFALLDSTCDAQTQLINDIKVTLSAVFFDRLRVSSQSISSVFFVNNFFKLFFLFWFYHGCCNAGMILHPQKKIIEWMWRFAINWIPVENLHWNNYFSMKSTCGLPSTLKWPGEANLGLLFL